MSSFQLGISAERFQAMAQLEREVREWEQGILERWSEFPFWSLSPGVVRAWIVGLAEFDYMRSELRRRTTEVRRLDMWTRLPESRWQQMHDYLNAARDRYGMRDNETMHALADAAIAAEMAATARNEPGSTELDRELAAFDQHEQVRQASETERLDELIRFGQQSLPVSSMRRSMSAQPTAPDLGSPGGSDLAGPIWTGSAQQAELAQRAQRAERTERTERPQPARQAGSGPDETDLPIEDDQSDASRTSSTRAWAAKEMATRAAARARRRPVFPPRALSEESTRMLVDESPASPPPGFRGESDYGGNNSDSTVRGSRGRSMSAASGEYSNSSSNKGQVDDGEDDEDEDEDVDDDAEGSGDEGSDSEEDEEDEDNSSSNIHSAGCEPCRLRGIECTGTPGKACTSCRRLRIKCELATHGWAMNRVMHERVAQAPPPRSRSAARSSARPATSAAPSTPVRLPPGASTRAPARAPTRASTRPPTGPVTAGPSRLARSSVGVGSFDDGVEELSVHSSEAESDRELSVLGRDARVLERTASELERQAALLRDRAAAMRSNVASMQRARGSRRDREEGSGKGKGKGKAR